MRKLRRIIRSQRGALLVDAMFGAVVIMIIMTAAGSVIMAATGAATSNDKITTRSILLNTILSDEKPNLAKYSDTPQNVTRTEAGTTLQVALWRDTPAPGLAFLNAAVPRPTAAGNGADCSGTDRLDSAKCMTSRTAITTSASGVDIKAIPLKPGTAGAVADFTAPAGATELRYLLKVTAASADSTLTFGNRDHPEARSTIKIPSGQTGYYFGRILVNGGSSLFLESSGPAALDSVSTMIYEAP